MCRDKLLRLRSLYMSQFERLKHVYKNKRRKYLLATSTSEEGLTGESFYLLIRITLKYFRTDRIKTSRNKVHFVVSFHNTTCTSKNEQPVLA